MRETRQQKRKQQDQSQQQQQSQQQGNNNPEKKEKGKKPIQQTLSTFFKKNNQQQTEPQDQTNKENIEQNQQQSQQQQEQNSQQPNNKIQEENQDQNNIIPSKIELEEEELENNKIQKNRQSPNDDPEMQKYFEGDAKLDQHMNSNEPKQKNNNNNRKKRLKKFSQDSQEEPFEVEKEKQKTINEVLKQANTNNNITTVKKETRGRKKKQSQPTITINNVEEKTQKQQQQKPQQSKKKQQKKGKNNSQQNLNSFFKSKSQPQSQQQTQQSQSQKDLHLKKQATSQISQVSKQNQQINESNFFNDKNIQYHQIINEIPKLKKLKNILLINCSKFLETKDESVFEDNYIQHLGNFIDFAIFQIIFSQKKVSWADLYRPKYSKQLISKKYSQYIKIWMRSFYRKQKQRGQQEGASSFGYLDDDSNYRSMSMYSNSMNTQMKNLQISDVTTTWDYQTLLIIGPTSVGKSTFIRCAANDCNMQINEISNSSKRNATEIKKQVEGTQTIKMTMNKNFFNLKNKQNQSKQSSQQTLHPNSNNNDDDINLNAKEQSKKVTIIKDYDLELDNGFQKELQTLAKNSKIPLILTSNVKSINKLDKKDFDILEIPENYLDSSIIVYVITEIELYLRHQCSKKINLQELIKEFEKETKEKSNKEKEQEQDSDQETQNLKQSTLEEKILKMPQIQELSQNLQSMDIKIYSNLKDFEEISLLYKGNIEKMLNNFQIYYQDINQNGWDLFKKQTIQLHQKHNYYSGLDSYWHFDNLVKYNWDSKVQEYDNPLCNIHMQDVDVKDLENMIDQIELQQLEDISNKKQHIQQQVNLDNLLQAIHIKRESKENENNDKEPNTTNNNNNKKQTNNTNNTLFNNPVPQKIDKRMNYYEEDTINLKLETTNFHFTQYHDELQNIQQILLSLQNSKELQIFKPQQIQNNGSSENQCNEKQQNSNQNNIENSQNETQQNQQNISQNNNSSQEQQQQKQQQQKMEVETDQNSGLEQVENKKCLDNQKFYIQNYLRLKTYRKYIMNNLLPELRAVPKQNRLFYDQFETIMSNAFVSGEVLYLQQERLTRRMIKDIEENMENNDPYQKLKQSQLGNKLKKDQIEKLIWLLKNNYQKVYLQYNQKTQSPQQEEHNKQLIQKFNEQPDEIIEEAEFNEQFVIKHNQQQQLNNENSQQSSQPYSQ